MLIEKACPTPTVAGGTKEKPTLGVFAHARTEAINFA
jgi:hypothetical protein